ncbi:MAG: hypothetical protein ACYC1Q_13985 [Bacteroidia bacterium]
MKNMLFFAFFLFCGLTSRAQVQGTAVLPVDKTGEFSEWVSASYKTSDGTEIQFEYRLKLAKKTGMACHYEMEVKNNSDKKITAVVIFTYYDQLIKGNVRDEVKIKAKAGATGGAKMIPQGCKKAKDAEKKDDYSVCTACGMSYEIVIELK